MRLLRESRHLPFRAGRRDSRTAIVPNYLIALAVLGAAACGSGASAVPTAPGGPNGGTDIVALDLSCPASLLIAKGRAGARASRLRSDSVVSFEATWSSTRPDLVDVDAWGRRWARGGGGRCDASYRGRRPQLRSRLPLKMLCESGLACRVTSDWIHGYDVAQGYTLWPRQRQAG